MRLGFHAAAAVIASVCALAGAACLGDRANIEPFSARITFDRSAAGSSVVLDRDRFFTWIADADHRAIFGVDLTTGHTSRTDLGASPEQIVRVGSDHLAITLRETNEVGLYAIDEEGPSPRIVELARARVPSDPYGIALSARGQVLVTSAWGHAVTAIDVATWEPDWTMDVAREPRAVVVSPKGDRAYVTHLTGNAITVIDLGDRADAESGASTPVGGRVTALGGAYKNRLDRAMGAGTLHPTAALAYAAALNDTGSLLFVPHVIEQNGSDSVRSIPGAYGGVPVEEETSFASVAVLSTARNETLGQGPSNGHPIDRLTSIIGGSGADFSVAPAPAPCRQARGVAFAGDRLFVASQGTSEIFELDARAIDPATSVRRAFRVAEGPSGVDVDRELDIAVAYGALDHALSVIDLSSGAVRTIAIADDPLPPDLAAGRRLFTTERDRRITRDGRSCAGCHPEGRDDAVVWKLGAGPRQTPTLVGRLDRGPFGWLAKHDRIEDNMRETITRLGGTGLSEAELSQIAAYLRHGLRAPSSDGGDAPGVRDEAAIARGRALFTSPEVGCSTCHVLDREGSDRSLHDVGSKNKSDLSTVFRTPPLLHIGGTAPYFHDGRYATLEALLADNLDRMGQTSQLPREDLAAIAAFLRTL